MRKKSFSTEGLPRENMKAITKGSTTLTLVAAGLLLLLSEAAFAHGNEKHVIGTVKSVTDHSITVTTADGKTQEVRVTEATLFERGGHSATLRDLKPGDRVVIHAVTKNGILEAHTVKIGPAQGK